MCFIKSFYTEDECKGLAHKLYEGRNKEMGHQEEDYFKAKRMIEGRVKAGLSYCIAGLLLIITEAYPDWSVFGTSFAIKDIHIWCIGWTAIGLGAGLINTKLHSYKIWWMQHVCYCGFVLVVISTLAYVTPAYINSNVSYRFYFLSMLIGLIGGFLGDALNEIGKNLLKIPRS